ncbi:hypothetical protein AB0F71_07235 [Kitasatospora sp. NPDC028055]|uniref:hypothetical protein n=1 Tax=Kitasatospora sp. NPDC028055 TaxID=3155653 RepID=UPI0033D0EBD0
MNTVTNNLDARDPRWWRYPTAATLLVPLCWTVSQVAMIGYSLFSYCALHSGCDQGSRDAHQQAALVLGWAQLVLALGAWPGPRSRRWTVARFVLSALSAMCGAGSVVALTV